ncbi:MAG: ABC transporter ATP-binding protein [Peptococcaceae bacterium]|nr:ABC transporter ATP-binding protein [Peptococcaceae bacterium]
MIDVHAVTKSYNGTKALDRVSFYVAPGEIVGLVGANGAGKTTTIQLLLQLMAPDSGTISINGKPAEAAQNIAYIPDTPVYYEFLTVREHLQFIHDLYPENTISCEELINRLSLRPYLDKMPDTLSKGNKQKLMIATALLRDFDYLVADEPFTGLDPRQISTLKTMLLELRARGKGILLSTHLLDVIELFCDRYVMLHTGRVIATGSKAELLAAHGLAPTATIEECYLSLTDCDPEEWYDEENSHQDHLKE